MSGGHHTSGARLRREPTRWLLIGGVLVVTVMVLGVVALGAAAPEVDTREMIVEVPALALDDARTCTRADADVAEDIRGVLPPGGRVSSTQVFGCPIAFDGIYVSFAGEVIGELLPRRGGAWAQVNDDAYALEVGPVVGHRELHGFNTGMAVWLPDGLHERIQVVGRPGVRGDVILVRGTLYQADPDDGGGITLRADDMELLASGVEIDDPLHVPQAIVALVLGLAAVGTLVWSRAVRRR